MNILFNNTYTSYTNINFNARKTKPTKEEFEELIKQGLNCAEISSHYGKSNSWTYQKIKKFGIKTPKQLKKGELYEKVIELLKKGFSTTEIGGKLGKVKNIYYFIVSIIGKDGLKQIKQEGYTNKIKNEKELLKKYIDNDQDTAEIYKKSTEKSKRIACRLKKEEIQLKKIKHKNIIDDKIKRVLELLKAGQNLKNAMDICNISRRTLLRHVDKKTLEEARNIARNKDFDTVVNYLNDGYNIKQVAQKFNCSREKIEKILGKEYHSVWKQERDNFRINKINKLFAIGMSYNEISDLTDIPIKTIRKLLKK